MKIRIQCVAWLAVLLNAVAVNADEEGFALLFNGKDLSGWVPVNVAPNTFTAKDGMIVSTGKPTGVLRTSKQYENFILELEWRHMQPKGNAGVFVWSHPLTAQGTPFAKSIEVQVLDGRETANYTSHGDVFSIHGADETRSPASCWCRALLAEREAQQAVPRMESIPRRMPRRSPEIGGQRQGGFGGQRVPATKGLHLPRIGRFGVSLPQFEDQRAAIIEPAS